MPTLFGRQIAIQVDTVRVTGLRMTFDIKRTVRKEPSPAIVTIYNLAESTRKSLQKDLVRTVVEAGYEDNVFQVFAGDLRQVTSVREGSDWVTRLEAGDGEKDFRTARINKSFRKGDFVQLVKEVAASMAAGAGNLLKAISAGKFEGLLKSLSHGVVLRGRSVDVLDRLLKSGGFEWSIQDGQLQVLEVGAAVEGTAVLLTPETGLIGSPEVGTVADGNQKKGKSKRHSIIKARSLLQPIFPGRKVDIRSAMVNGLHRVELAHLHGDNFSQDWYTDIEAVPL